MDRTGRPVYRGARKAGRIREHVGAAEYGRTAWRHHCVRLVRGGRRSRSANEQRTPFELTGRPSREESGCWNAVEIRTPIRLSGRGNRTSRAVFEMAEALSDPGDPG